VERGYAGWVPHETDYRELAALEAFHLDPGVASLRPVGRSRVLGNDAFELQLASLREHLIAVRPQMLAVKDWGLEASFVEEHLEDTLAFNQGCLSQIEALQVQEVERIEQQVVLVASASSACSSEKLARPSLITTISPSRIARSTGMSKAPAITENLLEAWRCGSTLLALREGNASKEYRGTCAAVQENGELSAISRSNN